MISGQELTKRADIMNPEAGMEMTNGSYAIHIHAVENDRVYFAPVDAEGRSSLGTGFQMSLEQYRRQVEMEGARLAEFPEVRNG